MLIKKLILTNKLGLHARAAATFVKTTHQFSSEITVTYNGKQANGKSLMSLMMLTAGYQAQLEIKIEGTDEVIMAVALETLFNEKFGEDQ